MAWLKKVAFRARHSPLRARVRLLAALPRPVLSGAPRTGSIAKVIADSAFARVPPDERDWAERIEARRRELVSRQGQTEPVYGAVPPHGAGPLAAIYEPVRVGLATWLMSLPEVWCVLLMRMVRELAPRSCLEWVRGWLLRRLSGRGARAQRSRGADHAGGEAGVGRDGRGRVLRARARAGCRSDGADRGHDRRRRAASGPLRLRVRRRGAYRGRDQGLPRRHPAPHDRARGGRVRRCRREPGDQARLGLDQAPSPGCVRVRSLADGGSRSSRRPSPSCCFGCLATERGVVAKIGDTSSAERLALLGGLASGLLIDLETWEPVKTPATDFGESSISARARMAAALVRLAANRDPRARPIRKALRATVRGRGARRGALDRPHRGAIALSCGPSPARPRCPSSSPAQPTARAASR